MSDINDPKNQAKMNHFIVEHAPLISLHLKQLRSAGKLPSHLEDEDLHSFGVQGLIEALHKYNPERGVKFSTYAGQRIRGLILDHASAEGPIPKHIRTQAKKLQSKPQSESAAPVKDITPKPEPSES